MSIPPLNLIINLGVNMLKFISLVHLPEIIIDFINNDAAIESIECNYDEEGLPSYTFNFRNGYKVCFAKKGSDNHSFTLQTFGLEYEEYEDEALPKTISFVFEADLDLIKSTCLVVSRYDQMPL